MAHQKLKTNGQSLRSEEPGAYWLIVSLQDFSQNRNYSRKTITFDPVKL